MITPWARLFGFRSNHRPDSTRVADLLSRVPIFEELNRRELASIERILHRREYLQDECIFRQGEPGLGMYIVEKGSVAIVSEPDNQQLFEMDDGDFFGEVSLFDQGVRSATAIAKTPCAVFGFFQPDLLELVDQNPRLGLKIVLRLARHVGQRLRRANGRVLSLTFELEEIRRGKFHDD